MNRTMKVRRWLCKTSALAALLLVISTGIARGQQNQSPIIADIQKAWQSRQDRVRTARFTWKEQRTWPKGSVSSALGGELERRTPELKGKIMPPLDKTVDFLNVLYMNNDKCRFEYEGEEWESIKQVFRKVKYISVFDGKTAKDLYPNGRGHAYWPIGAIRRGPNYRDAGLAAVRPMLLVYRPFALTLQPTHIQALTLRGQPMMINQRPCVELVQQLPRNTSHHLWIDTSREYSLARRVIIDQEVLREQIDFHYRFDSGLGWVPKGWKIISNNQNGGLFFSINAVVTSAEFDMDVESSIFDLEFPPGSRMVNENTNDEYIIRLNGTKRPILAEDIGATYDQMLNSDPGEALRPQSTHVLRSWWGWAIAAIGSSALSVFIWRRFTIRRSLRGMP